ncbi:MAG: hypothetical protein HW387_1774 [Parachlamydiales bacterium]|nr:hypothetical protein [Parachlamydiales bacterium]
MNISIYTGYFHDGSIINIEQSGDGVCFSMQSAEMHEEDLKDNIALSKYHRIKGKLHLEKVKIIRDNDQIFLGVLRMLYDGAGILDFEISKNNVKLFLEWVNYPPHPDIVVYSSFEIEAEKIWWENIPDLGEPFW